MQSLTPSRLRPMLQRIYCLNEVRLSSRASASVINRSLISVSIPEKPKRPGNPFLQFMKDVESKIYSDKPDANRKEIMKTASVMWQEADDCIKNRYNDIFKEKNKEYEKKMEEFHKNLTTEQKTAIAELNEKVNEKKKTNKFRRALKELGKPTRPASGYGLFLMEHPQKTMLEGETNKMRLTRLSNDWKELSEDKKDAYFEKARELLNNYTQDLKQWEKSMLKKLDMDEEDIQAIEESNKDGKSITSSKRMSNHIFSMLKKQDK